MGFPPPGVVRVRASIKLRSTAARRALAYSANAFLNSSGRACNAAKPFDNRNNVLSSVVRRHSD